MELTFITIHDLTHEARVLFASLSISDVLGWIPEEVAGKSGFEFFHPEEAPFARSVYGRGVQLDRAAVLHYCSLRARDGSWVSCECAFTIVYNVMVVSVSVYRRGRKSHRKIVPRISTNCSPADIFSKQREQSMRLQSDDCSLPHRGIRVTTCSHTCPPNLRFLL